MDVEFLAENIENLIPLLIKTLPIHSPVPVLSSILIQADTKGFFLSATDLELGTRVSIPAKIEKEGSVAVPGKQFLEALATVRKGKVKIIQEGESIILTTQGNKLIFQTIGKDEFPNLFEEKGKKTLSLTGKEVKRLFSKLTFAVAVDESRPELTGILLVEKEGEIHFVATDGFRLSFQTKQGSIDGEEGIILSSKLIQELLSIKEEDQEIEMYVHKKANQVLFETQNISLVGRLLGGEFPNYKKVIPTSYKTKAIVDKEDFLQKLKLASVFARESANITKISIKNGTMFLFSKSNGLGEGSAEMEVTQEGEDNEIAFNIKFLLDLLRSVEAETVIMELNSPLEPALFKTEKDAGFLHVIMPVRIQE